MRIVVVVMLVMIPAGESVAFTKAGDSVSLQVQLMVASSGRLITGEKDVVVRLVSPVSTGQTVYWEKTHESVSINEGVLSLSLSGVDDQGNELVADMFDRAGIQMEVESKGKWLDWIW